MPYGRRGYKKTEEDLAFNTVVGRNIKYLRKANKLNQTKVADHCQVRFQQLQKYEKGMNGCSAFRLHQLAKFFNVGMDVLVDPKMIKKHRGFTGQDDWMDELAYQKEAEEALDKQILSEEIQKEMASTGKRLTEVISKCP